MAVKRYLPYEGYVRLKNRFSARKSRIYVKATISESKEAHNKHYITYKRAEHELRAVQQKSVELKLKSREYSALI